VFSLFEKQYYAAISLFMTPEKAFTAYVDRNMNEGWDRSVHYIDYRDGNVVRSIGWVMVSSNDSWPKYWNQHMRDRDLVYALWPVGPFRWPAVGSKWPDLSDYEEVKLATVYPVRARTELRAAQQAWALFLASSCVCVRVMTASVVAWLQRRAPRDIYAPRPAWRP
jgi:hypothetical protein